MEKLHPTSYSRALQIRPYEAHDATDVWMLHNLALDRVDAHPGNGPWDDDLHAIESVYLTKGGEFLVGEWGGILVAMGALKRLSPHRAEITRTRVHPEHQRRGFGRAILDRLEARAVQLGYGELYLETTTRQVAAQGLYRSSGYGETHRFTRGRFTCIAYEKRFNDDE